VRTSVFFISLFCFSLEAGQTGPPIDQALNALSTVHQFREVAMSADGSMLAWVEIIPGKDGSAAGRSAIFVKDLKTAGAAARSVVDGVEMAQGLAWSREGKLAFVASGDSEPQLQLYVVEKPGRSKPRKVTDVEGYLADPRWSPDGAASRCCGCRASRTCLGRWKRRFRIRALWRPKFTCSGWRWWILRPRNLG
jgi:hypothetical protein